MNFKSLLFLFTLGISLNVDAQSYDFTVTNEPYTDLVGSTSLNEGITWDDPSFMIPLEFDFQFFDTVHTSLSISDIGLGASLGFLDIFAERFPLLIAYGGDIIDRGYDFNVDEPTTGSQSNISYLTEGVEGSRILKIEWNNVGFFGEFEEDGISSDWTNFQLWLYEGSSDIEVRFGENSISSPEFSFDGETGSYVGLVSESNDEGSFLLENIFLTGNPAEPQTVAFTSVDSLTYLDGVIPEGTVYRFSRSMTSSVSTADSFSSITVFPNPVTNSFFIESNEADHVIQTVNILDFTGKVIENILYTGESIDVSTLASGIYLLDIKTTNGMVKQRIVKR